MKKSTLGIITIFLILLIAAVIYEAEIITPYISSDFEYSADLLAIDTFYSEKREKFNGPQLSKTLFSYEIAGKTGDIYLIKNIFDVRTLTDEKIFFAERVYAIDERNGRHVAGHGDNDRTGYLFAPRNLKLGQPFTYWHVNYDEPALMRFKNKENIEGLTVYRYETDYHADQTSNLGHLPGVGIERGVNLDINLQLWVEPFTGRMIKYEDHTTAYYYDLKTNERIHPWNQFNNRFTAKSIHEQVEIAQKEKRMNIAVKYGIPALIAVVGIILIAMQRKRPPLKRKSKKYR